MEGDFRSDAVKLADEPCRRRTLWKQTLTMRWIWIRSLKIGACVGLLQVMIHQGDVVLQQGISWALVMKSIVSPILAFAVAFYATASTQVDRQWKEFKP